MTGQHRDGELGAWSLLALGVFIVLVMAGAGVGLWLGVLSVASWMVGE